MFSLLDLNSPQRKAAETIQGPLLILAGAGSGKTRTITYRIANMIENYHIPAKEILAVSFTNKAASELKERVAQLIPGQRRQGITLSTFHSLGIQILREEITKLGYQKFFTIYDTADQMAIVREALKNYRAEKAAFDKKVILSKIGFLKNQGISSDQYKNSHYFNHEDDYDLATEYVYQYYQEKLHFFNALDFDDILFLNVRLFKEFPEVAYKFSKRFQYIMIDEYQDTNALQFEIVKALTSTHQNICVVGDDDQSIYAFRGANVTNILNFENQYNDCQVIKLEQNYRSTNTILNLANEVIRHNLKRKEKALWSDNQSSELPLLWSCADSEHEASIVVEDIISYQKKGLPLSELAVLYRSNTQVAAIEDQLRLMQVPYTIVGGQKFYDKKEVKDLIAYLSLILNPYDEINLRRVINTPARGLGAGSFKKYLDYARDLQQTLFKTIEQGQNIVDIKKELQFKNFAHFIRKYQQLFKKDSLSQVISELIADIQFEDYIDKCYDNPKQAALKKNDVRLFIESAKRFELYFKDKANLKNFVERLLLADSQDKKDEPTNESSPVNQVTLMTLHSSKGLEFDRIYLIGLEEELLPHKRVLQNNEDISEERRLCYVGITRARKNLIMTYCKEREFFGKKVPRTLSRFLINLAKDKTFYQQQDRTTFGHLSEQEAKEYKSQVLNDLIKSLQG